LSRFSPSIRFKELSSFFRCFLTKNEEKEPPFLFVISVEKRGVSILKIFSEPKPSSEGKRTAPLLTSWTSTAEPLVFVSR